MRERGGPVDFALFTYWVRVDVRYSDLDTQGVVNNATYLTYFEHARVHFFEWLRAGMNASDGTSPHGSAAGGASATEATGFTAADVPFVLARATCMYRRPITGLAPVHVGVRCTVAGRATIEMEYVICDRPNSPNSLASDVTLYASGTTTAVCVDARKGKPRSLPEWARRALEMRAAEA
ncbi:MAG TPA: thioesterase family protein [Ktedonobacterales bacterium]|nr:thioesterase family protein [Ktedonobacterales bacterium]